MTVAIHQPDYIPYLGYFYKIAKSDVFVFLDDAQFSNNGGHDRNLIKTPLGTAWLKIPVRQTLGDPINAVRTKDELGWKARHLDAIRMNYEKAPFFGEFFPVIRSLMDGAYDSIAVLNEAIILGLCRKFGMDRVFLTASDLDIKSKKEQRVIDICRALNADTYLSGNGARAYQSEERFAASGIRLAYSEFEPAPYPQLWGGFIKNLSIVDYIMNCGFSSKGFG